MVRRAHHDRGKTVRPERFLRLRSGHSEKPFALSREPVLRLRSGHSEKPFALSLSKGRTVSSGQALRLTVRPEPLEGTNGSLRTGFVEGYPVRLSVTLFVLRISRSRQTGKRNGLRNRNPNPSLWSIFIVRGWPNGHGQLLGLLGLLKKMLEGRGALRPAPYSTGLRSPSRRLYPPGWNPLRGGTEPEA
jgi:hypothetical protein